MRHEAAIRLPNFNLCSQMVDGVPTAVLPSPLPSAPSVQSKTPFEPHQNADEAQPCVLTQHPFVQSQKTGIVCAHFLDDMLHVACDPLAAPRDCLPAS